MHKKGLAEETAKKRTRRTVKHQRGVVGASFDAISILRNMTAKERAERRQAAVAKVKQEKQAKEAKKDKSKVSRLSICILVPRSFSRGRRGCWLLFRMEVYADGF